MGTQAAVDMRAAPASSRRMLTAASLSITIGSLPVFLLGAMAVLMRRDLGFTESGLGLAVAIFFAASALGSMPGGRLAERYGARRALIWATAGSTASLIGIATVARTWAQLAAFLALGGIALALSGPAGNLALAQAIPSGRQGFAFGLKQAAVPAATLVAGLAVPVIGLSLGWRWAYAVAGVAGGLAYAVVLPRRAGADQRPAAKAGTAAPSPRALALLTLAAVLGSGGGNAMTAFYVESAVSRDVPVGVAGLWLALGSVCAIAGRLLYGGLVDRSGRGGLALVSWLWAMGAVGVALLSFARSPGSLAAATFLAFAFGWGWNGLFHHAVVKRHPEAPAAATGITTTGMFAGGTLGPFGFGALVHAASYTTAWLVVAGCLLTAAALARLADRVPAGEVGSAFARPAGGA